MDLTGGIAREREYVFAERPDDPEMRDSASFWVVDDAGRVALPRVGIEAVAANWETHGLQVNVAFADGRVYRLRADGPSWPPAGPDGRPTVLGAGPLAFRCVDPFDTWTMSFDGQAVQTSTFDLMEGRHDGPVVDVAFEVEAVMAVQPWIQGSLVPEAGAALATSIEGGLMGGPRYEQLFRATGTLRIGADESDGGASLEFGATGLRIRRQGVRHLAGFWGHCWQSALFPSGRAFGYIAYPRRDDGVATFNEGYVFERDGELVAAKVVSAPWLTELRALGQDVSLVLETEGRRVEIEGETVMATFDIHHDDRTFSTDAMKAEMPSFPALQQAAVRYRWDGEECYGMLERSSPLDKILRG